MHEVMCPSDDSHNVIEFKDFFIIKPSLQFAHVFDYSKTLLKEKGKKVSGGFEYRSDNTHKLSKNEFLRMLRNFNEDQ